MEDAVTSLIILFLVLLVVALLVALWILGRRGRRAAQISIHSSIERFRSIGELSVFKVITKEIVTETDHSWGDFGARYLAWVLSRKKMAMIFEFEIDFRYDLRSPMFRIDPSAGGYVITMPPCMHEAHIRDIQFYDEQRSRFLPWLLPDLLGGFLSDGFSEDHRNRLVAAAKTHAEQQARRLIGSLESDVQSSARSTLQSLAKAFEVESVRFQFTEPAEPELKVGYPKEAAG
jgi:hypothetical protein